MSRTMLSVILAIALVTEIAAQAPAPAPVSLYQRPINGDCVSRAVSGGSYFPTQYRITGSSGSSADQTTVTVAEDFNVTYFDNYKVITNKLVNETYVLYQCGTPPPASNSLPLGARLFSIPLSSVAVLETVPVAFLELLGVSNRLESVSSYSVGSCAQALLACSKTAPDSFSSTPAQIQATLLPVTDAIVGSSASSANDLTTLAFSATSDPGVLNRAEWIKFLGMFFNLDGAAAQVFNGINASYAQTKANASSASSKPLMAFAQHYTTSPDTAFEIALPAYKRQYIQDAGGQAFNISELAKINGTIYSPYDKTNQTIWFAWNRTGSGFPSMAAANAAFKAALANVSVLIDETYAVNPTTYNISTFYTNYNLSATERSSLPFVANNSVYREDGLTSGPPSYGLDWFEGAIARPDRVLLDFAQAAHPIAFPSHKRVWLRNISANESVNIVQPSSCNQITSCSQPLTPICPLVSACNNGVLVPQLNATSTCEYTPCSA